MSVYNAAELKFAANLKWLFTDLPLDERFAAAKAHGFQAIEYPTPYERSIADFAGLLTQHDLQLALINTPPYKTQDSTVTGIACNPQRRPEFRSGVELGLEYALGLGVDKLHVVAGTVPPDVSADRAWAEYVLNIAWAAQTAADTGVTLLIEAQNAKNSPGFLLNTQQQAVAVLEAVNSPNVKLLFDVFHVQVQQGNVSAVLDECAAHIGHVQIADAPARTEPGTGELAWDHIFSELNRHHYNGWIGCEYRASTPQGATVQWLQKVGTAR